MSKGLGKIERAIIEVLKNGGDFPVSFVVYKVAEKEGKIIGKVNTWEELEKLRYHYKYTESHYRSVLRAIRNLSKKEIIYYDRTDKNDWEDIKKQLGNTHIPGGYPGTLSLNVP